MRGALTLIGSDNGLRNVVVHGRLAVTSNLCVSTKQKSGNKSASRYSFILSFGKVQSIKVGAICLNCIISTRYNNTAVSPNQVEYNDTQLAVAANT